MHNFYTAPYTTKSFTAQQDLSCLAKAKAKFEQEVMR